MKKRVVLIFLALFFFLVSGTGEAFVPQAPHLLYLVIKKIKQPAGIEAYQAKKILNYQDPGKGYTDLNEKLMYLYPGRLRSEILSNTMTSFTVESDSGFIKVMDGVRVSREKSLVDLYTDVLLYRDYESLLAQLNRQGIDTTKVSFQRVNDTICYVIGRPLAKDKPFAGLWIEKDTLLPIKYVVEKKGWMVEFFYGRWQQFSRTWYPMQVSIFLDNQLFAMIDVTSVELTSDFSPTLFDVEHIGRLYPKNEPSALNENLRQVDELDKRIENFRKLYE